MSGLSSLAAAAATARTARPAVALALATLVGVEGSSYRQPGARLLVDAEGRVLSGAISGGCLEGDVAAHAAAVCSASAAQALTYDLRNDLEAIWGFGSACDGIAHLVLEPFPAAAEQTWLAQADRVVRSRHFGAVIVHIGDATTPSLGTVAMLEHDTLHAIVAHPPAWTVAMRHAAAIALRTLHPHREPVQGGTLFVEPIVAPIALNVIGAGRGAEAFASMATTLGWDVTVIDHRSALLDALVLPPSTRVVYARADDPASALSQLPTDPRSAVALVTHIFDTDLAWLSALLPTGTPYIGVLGSRQRAAKLTDRLRETGIAVPPAMLQRLHAPIGLDLGGETPESIALASLAEIEAVMHGRPGGALRERQSPIHARTPVPT